jgi:hypothetical protein
VPKNPLLEWFIRWFGAKPDSQRSLLKRLASYAIDPGVVDKYVYRIARKVEHNAVTFFSVQTQASSGFAINSRGLAETLIDRRPRNLLGPVILSATRARFFPSASLCRFIAVDEHARASSYMCRSASFIALSSAPR